MKRMMPRIFVGITIPVFAIWFISLLRPDLVNRNEVLDFCVYVLIGSVSSWLAWEFKK